MHNFCHHWLLRWRNFPKDVSTEALGVGFPLKHDILSECTPWGQETYFKLSLRYYASWPLRSAKTSFFINRVHAIHEEAQEAECAGLFGGLLIWNSEGRLEKPQKHQWQLLFEESWGGSQKSKNKRPAPAVPSQKESGVTKPREVIGNDQDSFTSNLKNKWCLFISTDIGPAPGAREPRDTMSHWRCTPQLAV